MKFIKKSIKVTAVLLGIIIATFYVTDTDYLLKAVRNIYLKGYVTAYLDDYKVFDNQIVDNGTPQPWPTHKEYNSITETERLKKINQSTGTVAYLIIKNDSIWFEKYYDNFYEHSKSNSFSIAKSYVSALLGKAIMEGYIKGLDQPVSDFFPQLKFDNKKTMTVGDLASMASGTNWDEKYYSPLSITTRAYFDDDLQKVILGLKMVNPPGTSFKYSSGDTQLLAMVLEKATGKKLYRYLSDSFWKPLGYENKAFWQVDSKEHNLVKAYCCIASNAKDFARLGKLYKDFGKWNGQQILDSTYVAQSIRPRFAESPEYGYGFWLHQQNGKHFFMMRGHLGQYVIVEPNDNLIIVRLGHQKLWEPGIGVFTKDISIYIEEAYQMLSL